MTDYELEEILKASCYEKYYWAILMYDLHADEVEANTVYENSQVTAAVELCGDRYIEENNLWEVLFPGYKKAEKIYNKKQQKSGIDYIVTDKDGNEINIDIKVCIGPDYSMKESDFVSLPLRGWQDMKGAPLEIEQKDRNGTWIFTNNNFKKTDYFLYIFMDKDQSYALVPFKEAQDLCFDYRGYYAVDPATNVATRHHLSNRAQYKVRLSKNESGYYFKYGLKTNKIRKGE